MMTAIFKKIKTGEFKFKKALLMLPLAATFLLAPVTAHASGWTFFGSLAGTAMGAVLAVAVGWPLFILNYILATILGMFIPLISYFIEVALQLNMNIVKTNMVGAGFTVTLSLANLGFVLAIIIIAIMTILRVETYALKKTLWKLVTAAVLVNFSLVICAGILTFSDTLSNYFLDSINPAGGGSSTANFASTLAGSFGPQRLFLAGSPSIGTNASSAAAVTSDMSGFQAAGQTFGSSLVFILNLIFPTIFLAFACLALGSFFIMLLIRYIYLGILLILMPFAWLLWIFPMTSGQWKKWWTKFIDWTMFAPIVLFFIWLSILTMGGSSPNNIQGIAFNSTSPTVAALSNFTGNILSSLLGPMLQMTMMVAMLFAGLFMAKAMGITFASSALSGAKFMASGIGRGVGGFAKRRGLMAGGKVLRSKPVTGVATAMRNVGLNRKTPFGRIMSLPTRLAARGIEATTVATTENLINDAERRLSGMTMKQLVNGEKSTFTSVERVAAMKLLGKGNSIEKISKERTHTDKTKELFETYGQAKEYEKYVEKKSGFNLEMAKTSDEIDAAAKRNAPQSEIDELEKKLYEQSIEFAAKFNREETNSMQSADLYSKKEGDFGLSSDAITRLSAANAYGFATAAPQFASAILSKLKGNSLVTFQEEYENGIDHAEKTGKIDATQAKDRRDKFDTIIARNATWFGSTGGGGTTGGGATGGSTTS